MEAQDALMVTETIEGAHPKLTNYPLLSEDLLVPEEDGTYYKFAPGLAVTGFVLTPEQVAALKPVKYKSVNLDYWIVED